jgi:hypothetical protein
MSERVKYHDNTQVSRNRYGYEYLAITLQDPEKEYSPYCAAISRYCVPGRIDTYMFDWVTGTSGVMERIRFCSEGGVNLPKALQLLQEDLDKPRVIELVKGICANESLLRYSRTLIESLLSEIAPKSKAYRAGNRVLKKVLQARRERLQKERANEQTSQSNIPPGGTQRPARVRRSHPHKPERSGGTRAAA